MESYLSSMKVRVVWLTRLAHNVAYLTLGDVPSVSNALVEYHCLVKVKAAIDQFRNGLKALGVLEMLHECPAIWKPLFVLDATQLTAGILFKYFFQKLTLS